jgi:hypothetical protein
MLLVRRALVSATRGVEVGTMNGLVELLVTKVGLAHDDALRVLAFLRDNAANIPMWLDDANIDDEDTSPGRPRRT